MADELDQAAGDDPEVHNPLCWFCDLELQPDSEDSDDPALVCPVHGHAWMPPDVAKGMSRLEERAKAYARKRGWDFE